MRSLLMAIGGIALCVGCAVAAEPSDLITIELDPSALQRSGQQVTCSLTPIKAGESQFKSYEDILTEKGSEIAAMKREIAHLNSLIEVKNGAIDKAVAAFQAQRQSQKTSSQKPEQRL